MGIDPISGASKRFPDVKLDLPPALTLYILFVYNAWLTDSKKCKIAIMHCVAQLSK